jgi:RNA polymerase sigma-70 factor (ECF subfamily)
MRNEALEKLFIKHYNEAKLYMVSMCRDSSLADELVSEAFLRAFSSIDEEKAGFKFWLFKVARNLWIDYLRKGKRIGELTENIKSDEEDVVSSIIKQEEYKALYRAISLLKDNYREVILLYYFEGMSVSEIAGILGQSIENVKTQMFRARSKLRVILEGEK